MWISRETDWRTRRNIVDKHWWLKCDFLPGCGMDQCYGAAEHSREKDSELWSNMLEWSLLGV